MDTIASGCRPCPCPLDGSEGDLLYFELIRERALIPLKEDLANWLNDVLPDISELLTPDNFLDRLDNGVLLCLLADRLSSLAEGADFKERSSDLSEDAPSAVSASSECDRPESTDSGIFSSGLSSPHQTESASSCLSTSPTTPASPKPTVDVYEGFRGKFALQHAASSLCLNSNRNELSNTPNVRHPCQNTHSATGLSHQQGAVQTLKFNSSQTPEQSTDGDHKQDTTANRKKPSSTVVPVRPAPLTSSGIKPPSVAVKFRANSPKFGGVGRTTGGRGRGRHPSSGIKPASSTQSLFEGRSAAPSPLARKNLASSPRRSSLDSSNLASSPRRTSNNSNRQLSAKPSHLDKEVSKITSRCRCSQCVVRKLSEGKYLIASKVVLLRLLNDKYVMVRVGGGWDTLEAFLARHDPCQLSALIHNREASLSLSSVLSNSRITN